MILFGQSCSTDSKSVQWIFFCFENTHLLQKSYLSLPQKNRSVRRKHFLLTLLFSFVPYCLVLPHPGPLIQPQLYKPVMPLRGGGKDLHHHVWGTLAAAIIQLGGVAHDGDIRLHYRVHVLRGVAVFLKEAHIKGGVVGFAFFPLQIVGKLSYKLYADPLVPLR